MAQSENPQARGHDGRPPNKRRTPTPAVRSGDGCGGGGCCDKKNFEWSNWTPWEKLASAAFDEDNERSFLGGVHVGYNWQAGAGVFGIEGDVSFSDGVDYLASLRARLGHSWEDMLVYATAGVAFAGFEDKTIHAHYGGHDFDMDISGDRKIGFVLGGGIEHKVSSNVSVGLEGLYYFFDKTEASEVYGPFCGYGCNSARCAQKKLTHEDDNDLFVVRARLSYHLQDVYEEPLK